MNDALDLNVLQTSRSPVIPASSVVSRWRWVMIGFAFFATTINYLDRQVLSVVAASPDFKAAVPLTEETYGYVASAFMLAYTVMNGLSGPFIDFVGTRIGYACCMLWWSLATGMLHVFSPAGRSRSDASGSCWVLAKRATGLRGPN